MGPALIVGIGGQDGPYLAAALRETGSEVWGLSRSGAMPAGLPNVRAAPPADVRDPAALERALRAVRPREVYHLAARSSVGESWRDPAGVAEVTGVGAANLLDAVRRVAPEARVFLASSSEVFGEPERAPQDESTPIRPASPYGAAKAYAHHLARIYRRRYGLHVAVGILYNHESPRRPAGFVTRKITRGAVAIARGEERELRLGNVDARRDWSYAGDVARAMVAILRHPAPEEFVVASGEAHAVREWCERAFAGVGLDYRDHVVVDPALWRPAEPVPLVGDASKARRLLGWAPTLGFGDLVDLLLRADASDGA